MRSIIKKNQVQLDEAAAPRSPARATNGASPAAPPAVPAPRARLVQLDEHTQAIEFTCPCGEVSLIEIQREKKP